MTTDTLLDLIYHYIIAIDNDYNTKEEKTKIIEKIKNYYKGRIPVGHFLANCADSIRERRQLKEIGDLILLNMEDENIFYDDYKQSKEKLNYYHYIYLPSLFSNE